MRRDQDSDIYILFDRFITEFLFNRNSILTDHEDILSTESLKECINNYIKNFKEGKESFGNKIVEQFANADIKTKLVFAHAEWLWAFSVDDISIWRKKEQAKRTSGLPDEDFKSDVFPSGFGSAGMFHKNNKYFEIKFVIELIQFLKNRIEQESINSTEVVKNWIEAICLFQKFEEESPDYPIDEYLKTIAKEKTLATPNILLYLTFPEKYERIASDGHKRDILNSFNGLLTKEEKESDKNRDEKIFLIRKELANCTQNEDFDFYENKYRQVWNYSLTQEGFSEVQGLQYKKAVILYGPPGTSKTFTAKRLAQALITNAYLNNKSNVIKYFNNDENFIDNRIHQLQLHSNYNYEDFVAGIHLVDNQTKAIPGKLFEICDAAKDDELPHVIILDEINRVDLSRLFGEVFSALENRDEDIDLTIGGLKLNIPSNLYVIGTMNEIDFSLEQIDFALRRRFLWFLYGYNEETLSSIIWKKDHELGTKLKEVEIEKFIERTNILNTKVTSLPELGSQYEIGHTFFGEIVEIYKSYKELNGYSRLQNQIFRKDGPAKILWEISIEPILSAFLGNMDQETKKVKLTELRDSFIN